MATSKQDIENALGAVARTAKSVGLMAQGDRLMFEEGVASGGVPPYFWLNVRGERCPFLPYLTVGQNKKDVLNVLQGANSALYAVHLAEAERRAKDA